MAKRIAIFASGAGSNAEAIIKHFADNSNVEIVEILCNKPGAGVLERAERLGIPTFMLTRVNFLKTGKALKHVQSLKVDLVVLAGFLWKLPNNFIEAYPERIVNIHPALLPDFGGKGMYGEHVHNAVIAHKEQRSGITIHYVDEVYDNGKMIFQATCTLTEKETTKSLTRKIQKLEHRYFPRVIGEVLEKQGA
jgi:phosphoribosylglycinamide formyltransferase-1